MVEAALRRNSLHIEANDQTEAIRLAKDAVLEDGLLIFAQRMDKGERAEDEAPERSTTRERSIFVDQWSSGLQKHFRSLLTAPKRSENGFKITVDQRYESRLTS
jgi:hypothetical protein